MAIKDNVTQLDILLEAIRYIDSLREKLDREMKKEIERHSEEYANIQVHTTAPFH